MRFEELGWPLPDGAAKTPSKAAAKSPKKRAPATDNAEEGGDVEMESPTKKPHARKPKKDAVKKEVDDEDMAGGVDGDDGVKEALLDEGV